MKIIFAGTPDFAAQQLKALLDAHFEVVAVYTQPDRRAGRGRRLQFSPVKQLALQAGCVVEQPEQFKAPALLNRLQSFGADLMVVAAYGLILPPAVLALFPYGAWNVHASLLPRWRGASPIQQAILAGDQTTGITLMQMEAGLDTGPMLAQAALPILAQDNSEQLTQKLAQLGAKLLIQTLHQFHANPQSITPMAQDPSLACYAPKISKAQAQIDWQQPALTIVRAILAYRPWPIAFTVLNQTVLRIWDAQLILGPSKASPGTIVALSPDGIEVACGQDKVRLTALQWPGKPCLPSVAILNSAHTPLAVGQCFGPVN